MFMVFDSIFGIFRWSTSLGWSNPRLGRWFGLGHGHFFGQDYTWDRLCLNIIRQERVSLWIVINHSDAAWRLSDAPWSNFNLPLTKEKKKFNSCPPFVLIDIPYRRTRFSGPILPETLSETLYQFPYTAYGMNNTLWIIGYDQPSLNERRFMQTIHADFRATKTDTDDFHFR